MASAAPAQTVASTMRIMSPDLRRGPVPAGKTTFMRLIAGLEPVTTGSIILDGEQSCDFFTTVVSLLKDPIVVLASRKSL